MVHQDIQLSPSTQSVLYHLANRKPALVFIFTRPTSACLETYARHSSHSSLASPTIFTSHYRKNGHFQTSAPVLLEHSLSFTLQLFRQTIPHTQTLTLRVIVLRSHALPFRARAQVTLSGPLVSLFPCTRAPISPVAVACTRTERFTQTVRHILSRFEPPGP